MEEIGIFFFCAVVGFMTVRISCVLRNKLNGGFDEVLPYILVIGFFVLYVAYWGALAIGWVAELITYYLGVSLECPKEGLLEVLSWRDIDAIWAALILSPLAACLIDFVVMALFMLKDKTVKWGGIRRAYEENLLGEIISKEGDDFQRLQWLATTAKRNILVTLTNDRLYYGIPAFKSKHPKMVLTHTDFRQLQMEPLLSGYRDPTEKRVILTDAHPPLHLNSGTNKESSKPVSLLEVPYDKIVSLQYVDATFLMQNAKCTPGLQKFLDTQRRKTRKRANPKATTNAKTE